MGSEMEVKEPTWETIPAIWLQGNEDPNWDSDSGDGQNGADLRCLASTVYKTQ